MLVRLPYVESARGESLHLELAGIVMESTGNLACDWDGSFARSTDRETSVLCQESIKRAQVGELRTYQVQ